MTVVKHKIFLVLQILQVEGEIDLEATISEEAELSDHEDRDFLNDVPEVVADELISSEVCFPKHVALWSLMVCDTHIVDSIYLYPRQGKHSAEDDDPATDDSNGSFDDESSEEGHGKWSPERWASKDFFGAQRRCVLLLNTSYY